MTLHDQAVFTANALRNMAQAPELFSLCDSLREHADDLEAAAAGVPLWRDCLRCKNPVKRNCRCGLCDAPEFLNWPELAANQDTEPIATDCAACGRDIEETDKVAAMYGGRDLPLVNGIRTGETLAYIHERCRDLYCSMQEEEKRNQPREVSDWELERFVERTR